MIKKYLYIHIHLHGFCLMFVILKSCKRTKSKNFSNLPLSLHAPNPAGSFPSPKCSCSLARLPLFSLHRPTISLGPNRSPLASSTGNPIYLSEVSIPRRTDATHLHQAPLFQQPAHTDHCALLGWSIATACTSPPRSSTSEFR
jgi:hypothetical protein